MTFSESRKKKASVEKGIISVAVLPTDKVLSMGKEVFSSMGIANARNEIERGQKLPPHF